jgi:2-polyprenyl-3-methyl-5-hydroxy-6-metoxy-1,4-benzoquinol methylase
MPIPWILQPASVGPSTTTAESDFLLLSTGMPGASAPKDWREPLMRAAQRHGPGVVTVAKRIASDGSIVAMGEVVVHPKGLHSIGHGLPRGAHRFPEEVDGAMDGIAAFPRHLVEGLPAPSGSFGLLTWCLEARLRGGRIVAVPDVAWTASVAPMPIARAELDAFIARFGFHPFAPDIDAIAARADLAPLRWQVRFFGGPTTFDKYEERGAFHWKAYREHDAFRARAGFLVRLATECFAHAGGAPILDIGCGDGLYTQLLVDAGLTVIGTDLDEEGLRVAREATASAARPATFLPSSAYDLRFGTASAGGVMLLDVIEHLHNPTLAIREIARVLSPDAPLLLSTPEWRYGAMSDPVHHAHEFTQAELTRLLTAEGLFAVERTARIGGSYRDLVIVARRANRIG